MLRRASILLLLLGCDQAVAETALPAPPDVRGEAEAFMLTYFDKEGVHTATRRGDIPEESRQYVRVQPLSSSERAPAGSVFVADLREAGPDGAYPVFVMERAQLETLIDSVTGAAEKAAEKVQAQSGDVTLYGASWCGACRSARDFLKKRGVAFTELDIEKDTGARAEMTRKLKAAGRAGAGIPVIDVRGKILTGFNPRALSAAIGGAAKP